MRECSVFEYYYRDASNYKSWGSLLLCGVVTSAEIEILRSQFDAACSTLCRALGLYQWADGGRSCLAYLPSLAPRDYARHGGSCFLLP